MFRKGPAKLRLFCPVCPVPSAAAGRHIGKPDISCERLRREGGQRTLAGKQGAGKGPVLLMPGCPDPRSALLAEGVRIQAGRGPSRCEESPY